MPTSHSEGLRSPRVPSDARSDEMRRSDIPNGPALEMSSRARKRVRGHDSVGPTGGDSEERWAAQNRGGRLGIEAGTYEHVKGFGQVTGAWILRETSGPKTRLVETSSLRVPPASILTGGEGETRSKDNTDRIEAAGGTLGGVENLRFELSECILGGQGIVHVIGIGNQLKGDDSVGLEAVSSLRRRLRRTSKFLRIHGVSSDPERLISALASRGERMMIIDAVEAQREPGTIVFTRLSETRFGFFATHNIPLRLVPGVAENAADIFLAGIQPESSYVGESLSPIVKKSCDRLVEIIAELVECGR